MRFYPPLEEGRLIRRYKRFLTDIETVTGELLTIHCPNTGSMLNCMVEGGQVWFSRSNDPKRKLPGTWEIAETPQGRLACVNTARANQLVEEALRAGVITELNGFTALEARSALRSGKKPYRFSPGVSQMARPMSKSKASPWALMAHAVAAFPDAVTQRGAKHLRELAHLAREGVRAVQLYCVNLSGIDAVRPAVEIDAGYAAALREAKAAGVEVLAYGVRVTSEEICVDRRLDVLLD